MSPSPSDQSSSEFDSDFDHRPRSTLIADAIKLASSRPQLIHRHHSSRPQTSNLDKSPSNTSFSKSTTLGLTTRSSSRSANLSSSSQDEHDTMTAPLRIKRMPSLSKWTSVPSRDSSAIPSGAKMDVTASHLDRQFDDFLYQTTHPPQNEEQQSFLPYLKNASEHASASTSTRSRPRFSRMKSAPSLSRRSSVIDDNIHLDNHETEDSDFPYYGQRTDIQADQKSLKMAGSRPPSIFNSTRSRANSVRSRTSSFRSCLDDQEEQPVSGYLFLGAIPPHPPLPRHSSRELSGSPSSADYCTHTAAEKGKGRPISNASSNQPYHTFRTSVPQGSSIPNPPETFNSTYQPSLPSPQHAWYLLRVLIGLELRWEMTRAWKLTSLDVDVSQEGLKRHYRDADTNGESLDNDDRSTYSLDSNSSSTCLNSDHFPVLRYLIQHFLLTLPIIRDIVSMVPNRLPETASSNIEPEACSAVPVYWTAGILPILRRLHQANLSTSIELGSRGFLEIVGGVSCMRLLERFVATGVKVADNTYLPTAGEPQSASQLRTGLSQRGSSPHDQNPIFRRDNDDQNSHLEKPMIARNPSRISQGSDAFYDARRVDPSSMTTPYTDSRHDQRESSWVPPSSPQNPDLSLQTAHGSEEHVKTGAGREWQRVSAASMAVSHRAEVGMVTPSTSYPVESISSLVEQESSQDSQRADINAYEVLANEMSLSHPSDPFPTRKPLTKKSPSPEFSSWLPNIFDRLSGTTMNLSDTVGLSSDPSIQNHTGIVGAQDHNLSHAPTRLPSPSGPEIDSTSAHRKLQALSSYEASRESEERMNRNFQHNLTIGRNPPAIPRTTERAVASHLEELHSVANAPGKYWKNSAASHDARSDNGAKVRGDHQAAKVKGYDIDETEAETGAIGDVDQLTYTVPPGSNKIIKTPMSIFSSENTRNEFAGQHVPEVQTLTSAHYLKTSDNSNKISLPLVETLQHDSSLATYTERIEESRSSTETSSRKRRFTLRSMSRWINSTNKTSDENSEPSEKSFQAGTSRSAHMSSALFSVNAMSPTISRDNSGKSSVGSEEQPVRRFYAAMALPDTLYPSNANQLYRHGVAPKPMSMPINVKPRWIHKQGVEWPWGHPVPFWKGTPIHKVAWGGFEVDVVGMRRTFRRSSFLIRVRRPSRMDEYVLREESQFKRYMAVLDKEFPSAVIRRIPDHDIRPEDDIIDPVEVSDFFLRVTPKFSEVPQGNQLDEARPSVAKVGSHLDVAQSGSQRIRDEFGGAYTITVQPPSTHNTIRSSANDQAAPGLDSELGSKTSSRSENLIGKSPNGSMRRRNTLGSIFRMGNHQSRFSCETPSEHGSPKAINLPALRGPLAPKEQGFGDSAKAKTSGVGVTKKFSLRAPKASADAHRRALRSWLRDTLSIRTVGHHRETAAFLLLGSIVPKESDLLEIREREMIDQDRRHRRIQVAQGAAERAKIIHEWWVEVVDEFINGEGINNLSEALRKCHSIEELPIRFQKAIEWIQMNIAQGLHDLLVIGEQSDAFFEKLLSLNSAFPWFLLKSILKIPKTSLMCKTLKEVLFSKTLTLHKRKKSVLQRLINIAINEEEEDPLSIQKRIHSCRARIQSLTMCEKLVNFAHATRETKEIFRQYAESEKLELVVTIVRSAEEPRLDKYDLERVVRASKVYASLLRKNRNRITKSMTENISVRLILDLKLYLRLISQERDTKEIKDMLSEARTLEALEVLVTPFMEFLKRTYKIGDSSQVLDDAQKFVEQLITILNALRSRIQDPQKSVRIIGRLLSKHQQSLYAWLHSIHTHDSIIEEFFQWAWTATMFLRRGLSQPILLPQILPKTGLGALKQELDDLVDWESLKRKLQYEHLCRRYSADVDGDDPVIVEGDGFGKSKMEPLIEIAARPPKLEQIPRCLATFRTAILHTFLV